MSFKNFQFSLIFYGFQVNNCFSFKMPAHKVFNTCKYCFLMSSSVSCLTCESYSFFIMNIAANAKPRAVAFCEIVLKLCVLAVRVCSSLCNCAVCAKIELRVGVYNIVFYGCTCMDV